MNRNDINWSNESVSADISKMTNADVTLFLVHEADVAETARLSYAAAYFESTLQTLMGQFPEVRKEMEWRVNYLMNLKKELV